MILLHSYNYLIKFFNPNAKNNKKNKFNRIIFNLFSYFTTKYYKERGIANSIKKFLSQRIARRDIDNTHRVNGIS